MQRLHTLLCLFASALVCALGSVSWAGLRSSSAVSSDAGSLQLKVVPDRGALVEGAVSEVIVKISLHAPGGAPSTRLPLNLAVVLDRSGSMAGPKLEHAKQAAASLLDRLRPRDVLSLVAYDSEVTTLIAAQPIEEPETLAPKIWKIEPGGSTALYAGVEEGARQVRRHLDPARINRVLLLSDGLANVGPSSTGELLGLGRRIVRDGIAITTIGLGADYNEDLMASLAESSDANHYFVDDVEKLPEIFAKELGELLQVCAREVEIEIVCPEGVEPLEIVGRSETFSQRRATVRLSHLAQNQERTLFVRCRVSAPAASEKELPLAWVNTRYRDETSEGATRVIGASAEATVTDSPQTADASVRGEVRAELELAANAVILDEAIREADARRFSNAAGLLSGQADKLRAAAAQAPASPKAEALTRAAKDLDERAAELESDTLTATSRKELRQKAFHFKNSKAQ